MSRLRELALSRRQILTRTATLLLAGEMVHAQPPKNRAGKCIFVQAGRRVDALNAEVARFPSKNVDLVRTRIKADLLKNEPLAVVTSAACGTDLLTLEIAGQMKVERFIALPSAPKLFRISSVTDRPGDWGVLFDKAIKEAHVEVLTVPEGQQGYLETNLRLLDTAEALAKKHHVEAKAMVVWDQKSRGADDVTGHFLAQARARKLPIIEISTL